MEPNRIYGPDFRALSRRNALYVVLRAPESSLLHHHLVSKIPGSLYLCASNGPTPGDKTTYHTADDQERRRALVRAADHENLLEGQARDPATDHIFEAFVSAEIS